MGKNKLEEIISNGQRKQFCCVLETSNFSHLLTKMFHQYFERQLSSSFLQYAFKDHVCFRKRNEETMFSLSVSQESLWEVDV